MSVRTIGRYEILGEIGRGGMANVYHAHDPVMNRDVAVKMLARSLTLDSGLHTRFGREVRIIAALEHPAIVPVYDFGEEIGQPFLVMRYMSGGSLSQRLAEGPIPLPETTRILERIASALDLAHSRGVIHRDLKPDNILFDDYGAAYLADFGIAKMTEATTALTGNSLVGTPTYMSPEQIEGQDLDGRSDIYSLGVILFEMLTGRHPYEATTPIAVALQHVNNPVPNVLEVRPDLPRGYHYIISRAMAKDPAHRYPAAAEVVNDLQGAARLSWDNWSVRVQQRMLDVAMAREVLVGRAADLVAMVRQTESEGLVAIFEVDGSYSAESEDIVSKPFRLEFPVDGKGKLRPSMLIMRVNAPDFKPPKDKRQIPVPPEGDSEPVIFLLTPQKAGFLALTVELYKEETYIASRLLQTNGKLSPDEIVSDVKDLVTIPLNVLSDWPDTQYLSHLLDVLSGYFNLNELAMLCFDLGADVEELPGDTKSAKARGLISLMLRQQRLPELERAIRRERPALVLPKQSTSTVPALAASSTQTEVEYQPMVASGGRQSGIPQWVKLSVAVMIGIIIVTVGTLSPDVQEFLGFTTRTVVSGITPTMTPIGSTNTPTILTNTPVVAGDFTTTPTPTPTGTATPTPSPSVRGDRIVFQSNRDGDFEIYDVDIDGGDLKQLTINSIGDKFPAVSYDGMRIAFESYRDGNWEVYIMNADGSDQRNLTLHPDNDRLPSWSPDSQQIAFISDRDGDYDIYLIDAAGGGLQQVTNSSLREGHVSWSVNNTLTYNAGVIDGKTWEIYTSSTDGSYRRQLTDNSVSDWSPEWSPDGRNILYLSMVGANDPAVFVMDADGSNRRQIYNSPDYEWGARWSASGDRIVFTVEIGDFSYLYLMDADGSNVKNLAVRGSYPSWVR